MDDIKKLREICYASHEERGGAFYESYGGQQYLVEVIGDLYLHKVNPQTYPLGYRVKGAIVKEEFSKTSPKVNLEVVPTALKDRKGIESLLLKRNGLNKEGLFIYFDE